MTDWNQELAFTLGKDRDLQAAGVGQIWAGWASEVAADSLAFAEGGYGSVAALHDVLAEGASVLRYVPSDPHPIGYIRVLLGTEMSRRFYGRGPWEDLELAWKAAHPSSEGGSNVREIIERSVPVLQRVVDICLLAPFNAFGDRALVDLVDPHRVSPDSLNNLERSAGSALYTSQHWVWSEPLRLLALTALKAATIPDEAAHIVKQQRNWMTQLGTAAHLVAV